ncbi:MAG TPA: GDP-mannose 4,6-dehydratase [Solirubrobacteraceae bacterium]
MARRRALITGIAGQDGSYLAERLLDDDYEIHGLLRQPLTQPLPNIEPLRDSLELIVGDVRRRADLEAALAISNPDEIYHLASPSFVPDLWERPSETFEAVALATASLLELVRERLPQTRVMVASSREIFGDSGESPQRETSPWRPTNPYGVAKLAGLLLAQALRERDGLFVCSAILYNHESPRRPERFVTRRVTRAAAAIKLGLERELVLGDLDAVRDWCFAGDAMRAARLMLAHSEPGDYVIASGRGRSVRELVQCAFDVVGLDPERHLRVDPRLVRPPEPTPQVGDPAKAREVLGWETETGFQDLIASMVEADLRALTASV